VLVLERHIALSEALCHVLEAAGYRARYVADPPRTIVRQLKDTPPAVVVIGVESSGPLQERLALIEAVNEADIPTIGLTGHVDDPVRRRLLHRAGTAWVVGRDQSLERFVEVVAQAARGEMPADHALLGEDVSADELARARALDESTERLLSLAPRERAVLEHLRRGRTIDEIARADQVSVNTVRTQTRTILRKLGVSSQLAAVAMLEWVSESVPPSP
jgi:DNA-binding NarL/FixJ family response regulator